ncbi:hypothetical protein D3C87_875260 [compost metagenome]
MLHDVFIARTCHQLHRLARSAQSVKVLDCLVFITDRTLRIQRGHCHTRTAEGSGQDIVLPCSRCTHNILEACNTDHHCFTNRLYRDIKAIGQRHALEGLNIGLPAIGRQGKIVYKGLTMGCSQKA